MGLARLSFRLRSIYPVLVSDLKTKRRKNHKISATISKGVSSHIANFLLKNVGDQSHQTPKAC